MTETNVTNTFFRGFTDKSLAVALACDFLKHNTMPAGDVPAFVTTLHQTLKAMGPDAPHVVGLAGMPAGTGIAANAAQTGATGTDETALTAGAGTGQQAAEAPQITPKTPKEIRDSVRPDGIISFIDGQPYQTMKRHLTKHGHTPESYKAAFGLPADYPMTSPNYAAARRQMAQAQGLGTNRAQPAAPAPAPTKGAGGRARRPVQASAPASRSTRRAAPRTPANA